MTRKLAKEAGAAGFVTKSDLSRDLLSTIDRVTQQLTAAPPVTSLASDDQKPRWPKGGGEMGALMQESLTQMHRHSESKKVDVDIFYDAHTVSLRVRDFGKGISLERIRSFRDRGRGMGVGFGGMRERVRELGGVLRIEPSDPAGTLIALEIPLIEGPKAYVASIHSKAAPPGATQQRTIAAG